MMLLNEGPRTAAMARANISSGMARNTSTMRIRNSSSFPPLTPAMLPTMTPTVTVMATTISESRSEVLAPQITP